MKSVSYDDEKKWERLQRMRRSSKKKEVRDKVDEEVGISSAEKMADARKEAQLRRKEDLAKNAKKKKQQSDKQKARERKGSISASKTLTSAQLKKYDTDGDGKVRVVNASYDPVNEGADQKRTTKGRWVDDQGRSHNFSVSTRTGDRGYITQFIKSKFPAKQVIVTGQAKEKAKKKPKGEVNETISGGVPMTPQELEIQKKMSRLNMRLARKRNQEMQKAKVQDTETAPEQVKEDKAFVNVVSRIRESATNPKKFDMEKFKQGLRDREGAVFHGDPGTEPKKQPKRKPKPDTRTDAQKKADQDTANMDAVYGGKQRDRGLGT